MKKIILLFILGICGVAYADTATDILPTNPYKDLYDKAVDLEKRVSELREKEQSLENRTLTAGTMALTGIGGMELAQGLAEQRADKDAEMDMTAYMETFRCEYENGKNVKGGTSEIQLPSDNLFDLYQEYVTLAADLKERKEALGLKPGIESEVILDKANTSLYDDENTGITNGTYASLYRAKMGNEADQAKLTDEQTKSENRVKTGAITAGAGTIVGGVGNAIVNKDAQKKEGSETQ